MSATVPSVPLRVDVLGPLQVQVDGAVVDVPGPRRRAVLALLALAEGRAVTADDLVDALWPADPPESARQAIQTHVSRLRAHLGPAADRLETSPGAYRLRLGASELDLAHARSLLSSARSRAAHDPGGALAQLREAHALWRGPILADLAEVAPVAVSIEECARLRREVTDALVANAVDAGRAADVVDLATATYAADPLRESAAVLLMRALAAVARPAEALQVGRELRQRLAEETGLDPSPAVGELERVIAGGGSGRAPGPSLAARPPTRLIGRAAEVAALHRVLADERLVTLVGTGGVGKTRVALEVVARAPAVTVLLLAPVTDPTALPSALAAALQLDVVQGDVLEACTAVLNSRPGILLVDNCEHLLDPVRDLLAVVLPACPQLTVLATSREPLGLPGEHTVRLAPLPLPGADDDPAHVASVALFLERAARVRTDPAASAAELALVADIVRRLDGVPLAIELAASRLSAFSLRDLHDRLDRSLDLLGSGRPTGDARHRTLRSTVEWSYRLLSPDEQRLFRHVAPFVDGLDLESAEWLAADLGLPGDPGAMLSRLVDASMVDAHFEVRTRYRMLETLRAFGLDRIVAAGEDDESADRMLRWGVRLTTSIEAGLAGDDEPDADATLRRERANLRAVWQLARRRGAVDAAAHVVVSLYGAIAYRDLLEIRAWAEELAADPVLAGHPRAAGVHGAAAEAAYQRGDLEKAATLARTGLEQATDDLGRWYCHVPWSVVALARGSYLEAIEHALAATQASPRPDPSGVAALAALYSGDPARARSLCTDALVGAASPTERAWAAYVAGEIENATAHAGAAEGHYRHAVRLARGSGATFLVGVATVGLLTALSDQGRVQDALRGYRDVIRYFARTGNWTHLWATLRNLADLLRRTGDDDAARLLSTAADAAPDAPAVGPAAASARSAGAGTPLTRAAVLDAALTAIAGRVG
ncbi:BTAD domain-containing putative transcriptional regulator [Cellulomonas sp. Root137]|uniref:BTAD domain-containing putative transcriptional regulator n=1 Tax=Cellulomonas sp. Root137 TaxID=1736459 RepID=UPI0006FEA958|nr:BTAD domain-containing putative transcriptional regulator [Cellulomonas sp. Root137]KQY44394.1 transcriptional regulator [Cellulomonas sp. Root137]